VARKQYDGALRQHAQKGVCATYQVATCSERGCSLDILVSKFHLRLIHQAESSDNQLDVISAYHVHLF